MSWVRIMDFIFYKHKGVIINIYINYVGKSVDILDNLVDIFVDNLNSCVYNQYSLLTISAGRR